jgi:hypothetical protein
MKEKVSICSVFISAEKLIKMALCALLSAASWATLIKEARMVIKYGADIEIAAIAANIKRLTN